MLSGTTNRSRSLSGSKPDLAWSVPVMRVGFAGRGLVYLAVASFSLYAIWQGGRAQGTSSVLKNLEDSVAGDIVLALIALGMLAFAVWRGVEAYYDLDARGSDTRGIAARSAMIFSGLVALGIGGTAFLLLLADIGASGQMTGATAAGGAGSASGRSHIEQGVAMALGWPAGRWIVGAVGLAIVVSGVVQLVIGWKEKYRRDLIANRFTRRWNWALKAGVMGRGILIGVVGVLFMLAAWRADPNEAGGLDEAFAWLSQQPYGWLIVAALCVGLLGYAVFCFVNAVYRFVPKVAPAEVKALEARMKERMRPAT
jgi:heme/copper-type cytochrome/quinol oxidase subunit 2